MNEDGERRNPRGFFRRFFRVPTRRAAFLFYRNMIVQFILLFGLWILMSGHYDAFHMGTGAVCALVVVAVNLRLNKFFFIRDDLCRCAPIRIRRLFIYIPWLLWQIVIASLQVAAVVLNPKLPANPSFVRFRTRLPNIASRVILANSITLTPGTITVELEGDEFLVHSLIDASHSSIMDGTLPGQVARLYDRTPRQVVSHARVLKSRKGT